MSRLALRNIKDVIVQTAYSYSELCVSCTLYSKCRALRCEWESRVLETSLGRGYSLYSTVVASYQLAVAWSAVAVVRVRVYV